MVMSIWKNLTNGYISITIGTKWGNLHISFQGGKPKPQLSARLIKKSIREVLTMSGTIVGILGFLCIVAIVLTLFKSKTLPSIAFIVFPTILAMTLVFGSYYSLDNIADLIKSGFSSTTPTAALFVFSVLYFGIMSDAGMFDVIIGKLMKLVGGNVIGVSVMTPQSRLNTTGSRQKSMTAGTQTKRLRQKSRKRQSRLILKSRHGKNNIKVCPEKSPSIQTKFLWLSRKKAAGTQ